MAFSMGGIVTSLIFFSMVLVNQADILSSLVASIFVGVLINVTGELIRQVIKRRWPAPGDQADQVPGADKSKEVHITATEEQLIKAVTVAVLPVLSKLIVETIAYHFVDTTPKGP